MSNANIGTVLARQFDRMWGTLREAIPRMSDAQWRQSDCDWLAPVRLAYHLVETADFYRGESSRGFGWGSLGGDWEDSPVDALPTQAEVRALLDRVEPLVRAWLTETADADFLTAEEDFAWTGGTRLDRALYLLRHSQHHLGQINAELRRKDLSPGRWA